MENEVEADWLDLLKTWLDAYQNPAGNSLLYTFVIKTAQAEWHRLRVQREYDFHLFGQGNSPIGAWQPHEIKNYDLSLRYLTVAERRSSANTECSNTTGKLMRRQTLTPAGTEPISNRL